jgi:DNA-binding LacI/PurR family transcriptional regulator
LGEAGRVPHVTLADVAASAGVSRATASRALAEDPRISDSTRRLVHEVAASLDYVPNAAARSLRKRRTRTLGLLLPSLSDPFHAQVAAGFEVEAASHGYTVLFVAASSLAERRAFNVFLEHGADGICLVSSGMDPLAARARAGPERPVVALQPDRVSLLRRSGQGSLPDGIIRTDDASGVEVGVRHLLAMGCRSFLYLGLGSGPTDRVRREAARRTVAAAGAGPFQAVRLEDDAWRRPETLGARIPDPIPDAIVCFDDKLALALLDGLRARGIRVPGHVSVIGYDDIPFARVSNPRLTTVAAPTADMGRLAASALVTAIRDRALPPARVLPVELVVRESTLRGGRVGHDAHMSDAGEPLREASVGG